MAKKFWWIIALLVWVVPFGLAGGLVKADATTGLLPADRLQALLDSTVSDAGIPGIIMAVETPQGIWVGAAGKANLDTGQPMTTDLQVRLASVTKPFTAALIMHLVDEHKVQLTDTVEHWLPGKVTGGAGITLRMLLNHTSGLYDPESNWDFINSWPAHPDKSWTVDEFLAIVNAHAIQGQGVFHYCNAGYYILGLIAEAAAQEPLEDAFRDRFFTPLGMTRTAITRSGAKTAPYCLDYSWFGEPYKHLYETSGWNLSWDWTAGAGVTTGSDMLVWTRALFGGQAVSPDSLNKMLTMTVPIPDTTGAFYGLGIGVVDKDPFFNERSYNHDGNNPGVRTQWEYLPNSRRTIFIALNRSDYAIPPVIDVDQVIKTLLSGAAKILNGPRCLPAMYNLLLGD